jgi:hypothetical protein
VIDCDTKNKLNISKFQLMQPSSNTALYDTITQAVTALQIHKLVNTASGHLCDHPHRWQEHQVVPQPPGDNKLHNLKIILAGINLSGVSKQAMLKLASMGDDNIHFIDLQSTSNINNLFKHISLELKAVWQTRLVVS